MLRLLMSYNYLAQATELTLEYIDALHGFGTEHFDITVVLVCLV